MRRSFLRACRHCRGGLTLVSSATEAASTANFYGLWRRHCALAAQFLSTGSISAAGILPWESPSRETLLRTIDVALKDGNIDEALQAFGNYKSLHGLPEPRVLNGVIVSLTWNSSTMGRWPTIFAWGGTDCRAQQALKTHDGELSKDETEAWMAFQVVDEAIVSVDGYDADRRQAVRKATQV